MENTALIAGISTGFIDQTIESRESLQPQFLINLPKENKKVLTSILSHLEQCDEFWFSVAFVTSGGVATIIQKLEEIRIRNLSEARVTGRVLVSQYLNFTDPEALKKLLQFDFIDLRIDTDSRFHAKTYLFRNGEQYTAIIGSSNLTDTALTINAEWNLKVTATENGQVINDILKTKLVAFDFAQPVTHDFISVYQQIHTEHKRFQFNSRQILDVEAQLIKPNKMQEIALGNLQKIRAIDGVQRALIISATGTGKTFLSAFDVAAMKPKRVLFLVHRQNIAKKSMESYMKVVGNHVSYGLYSGGEKELKADYIFTTVQTLTREHHLQKFAPDHFDYIVIDETHRAAAKTYIRIIEHFRPKFLLGMTATPERTDGEDIFKLFHHNIAYEIRLKDALEVNLLTTFHYYGVSDITVDGVAIEANTSFNYLVSEQRVAHLLEKVKLYGTDSGRIKGLVFCSRIDEAKALAAAFTLNGYASVALSAVDTEVQREISITRLESNDADKLDFIFTVDIFNEGIDIPCVNMVLMLRATQSAIIFVQQLGRGLRKYEEKAYVTVIDFIGNYANNYMIPIALFGDSSYTKDNLRKLVSEGSVGIPGASTIDFDLVAKEKIFESINKANLNKRTLLRQDYQLTKHKLGRIPMMVDFLNTDARDPYGYVEAVGSYYKFVVSEENEVEQLSIDQERILSYYACEVCDAKRVVEPYILQMLLSTKSIQKPVLKDAFLQHFKFELDEATLQSAIRNLNFDFQTIKEDNKQKKWRDTRMLSNPVLYNVVLEENNNLSLSPAILKELQNATFSAYFKDQLSYAIEKYEGILSRKQYKVHHGFMLYEKYSRKHVFRILNWTENPVAQNVGGYMIGKDKKDCAIFVNYHKHEEISATTKYEDQFLDPHTFVWYSKSKRKLSSPDVSTIRAQKENNILLPLFVKKSNDEGQDFYFMGMLHTKDKFWQEEMGDEKKVSVVKCEFGLRPSVDESLYGYIANT